MRGSRIRIRIRNTDPSEGEGERMVPQETSMQGAGMGAGGRLDQVLRKISYHTSSYFWSIALKCSKQQQKMTQAVTLLAHARELLEEQRGRGTALPTSGLPGAPGTPKQTMQTEIRYPTTNLAIYIRLGNPFL